MDFNLKNKYSEWLQSKQFEVKKNSDITKESYLIDNTNILVHTAPLKSQRQNYEYFHFRKVVFLPTHLYEKNTFEIKVGDKVIDLLQCMYVVTKQSYIDNTVVKIHIQNFTDYTQDLPSFEVNCLQMDNNNLDVQAGILGDKYLALVIQSIGQIDIHILNLDLSLVYQYKKEHSIGKKDTSHFKYNCIENFFDSELDYHEPGLIYILGTQIVIRIDLNNKQVITKDFNDQHKVLLRLMPITQSEFKYYFKNAKSKQLEGYNINEQEFLILFVIMNNKIYQLNKNNLELIRQTNINIEKVQNNLKPVFSAFPIPISIKDRQRKKFSKWTFLILMRSNSYILSDWREQNFFQKEMEKYYGLNYETNTQRIFLHQDSIFVLFQLELMDQGWTRKDSQASIQIKISKKKGERNYVSNFQVNQQTQNFYFSQNFFIKHFFHPILYKNELTYPCYMDKKVYNSLFVSNFIGFHSFKEQAEKQAQYQIKQLNDSDLQMLIDTNMDLFTFQDNQKIVLYKINQNKITPQYFELPLQNDWIIREYFFNRSSFEQFFITQKNQSCKISSYSLSTDEYKIPQIQELKSEITCFSSFTFDRKSNSLFLPLIYDDGFGEYFCIFDANQKQIIQETVHKCKYTKGLLSHYDEEKKQFILLFFKKIYNSCYLYFYQLNMTTRFDFKFINMHKFEQAFDINLQSQYLNVKKSTFNVLIPNKPNVLIKFNQNKKFEIKKQIKNCLAQQYDQENKYEIDRKRQYFFLKNIKTSQKILYLGYYSGRQFLIQNILSLYDVKQNSVQFINKDIIVEDERLQLEHHELDVQIHINQLSNGMIFIHYGQNKIKILKY
ncbi:hypothetical protein TTHERM_00862750 (macronuclear) [Tetrahymena thermophila SB210]|uniref:Uncharacterized protein n=1 Tax=Tetrahymena thermophila (strain SB210) TaxID=312017 RepID=Q23JR1_TETTS|nr:hypothetical protein TTHERM_00862750 [Tetrahymena thermophila SB210]EAR96799.1 hypothetical protein TTHERM_00862750 [Tetrahymena thermophila SB210]|eukprot:XP_001017044.1 hypothetical protein TTHERM_00862750 [Tetrahymena thermophila SB210]